MLALKLFLTPFFISFVTLVGRRWGPAASGLIMGLPLTSGPVSLILALEYSPEFAARAAVGTIYGQASVCIFCLAFALAAQKTGWVGSSLTAMAAFLAATFLWNRLSLGLLPAVGVILLVILLVLRFIPRPPAENRVFSAPRWDLPARMVLAAIFVVLITTLADRLGPQLSGLLTPFPVFTVVIGSFTLAQQGPGAAARMLHGIVVGSVAFSSFFLVVGGLLPHLGIAPAYLLASAVAVGINAAALRVMQKNHQMD